MSFVDATHNLLFRLDATKWRSDLQVSARSHLCSYSEAGDPPQRQALAEHCENAGRGLYHPPGTGNPISWRTDQFREIPNEHGVVEAHRRAPSDGGLRGGPRDFVWLGLHHLASGKKVLRISVHPVPGAWKTPNTAPDKHGNIEAWLDWATRRHWLKVLEFTAAQVAREEWDIVLLGGDFNCALENDRSWYFPGPMLRGLYRHDDKPRAIDRLVWAHASECTQERRWAVHHGVHSDHAIHFAEYRLL